MPGTNSTPPQQQTELGRAARGAAITFLGATTSAALGFLLNFMIARLLGPAGAGVVLQAMGVFTIALSLALLGLDTAALWLLPRLLMEPARLRGAVLALAVPAVAGACLVAGLWWAVALADPSFLEQRASLVRSVSVVLLFLPAGALMTVMIATTRAFGSVLPFNLIDRVLVPGLRPILTLVSVGLGGGTTAVSLAWATPWAVGMTAALAVVIRQLARATKDHDRGPRLADIALRRSIARYAAPRSVAAILDQAVLWLDVILVGVIAGPVAAGVYGATSRFVGAGVVVSNALRIVVAPRFSALLGAGRTHDVQELYSVTAGWILLFGAPIYITLAVFASQVLSWLGPGFETGATSLVILAVGSLVVLSAGNIQSLLLMSGRSGLGALNKAIVVAFNVAGNVVLVPRIGIEGAAVTWALSMVLDTLLAAYQVRRTTSVTLSFRFISRVAWASTLCVATPQLATRAVIGHSGWAILVAVLLSGGCLLTYMWLAREGLRLEELVPRLSRHRRRRPGPRS
jgi:O-antigen/teichoic acid export membrane protein